MESNELVLITYEDAGPDVLGTVFRAVELSLSNLEPGDYTLTVEIELAGREPMTVGRPISIVPNPLGQHRGPPMSRNVEPDRTQGRVEPVITPRSHPKDSSGPTKSSSGYVM